MKILFLDEVHEILANRLTDAQHECIHAENLSLEECLSLVKTADGCAFAAIRNNCRAFLYILA